MFVTALDFEEHRGERGALRYDWMLSFTDLTIAERYAAVTALCNE